MIYKESKAIEYMRCSIQGAILLGNNNKQSYKYLLVKAAKSLFCSSG